MRHFQAFYSIYRQNYRQKSGFGLSRFPRRYHRSLFQMSLIVNSGKNSTNAWQIFGRNCFLQFFFSESVHEGGGEPKNLTTWFMDSMEVITLFLAFCHLVPLNGGHILHCNALIVTTLIRS